MVKVILMIVAFVSAAVAVTAGGFVAGRIYRVFIAGPPMERTDYRSGSGSPVKSSGAPEGGEE